MGVPFDNWLRIHAVKELGLLPHAEVCLFLALAYKLRPLPDVQTTLGISSLFIYSLSCV